MESFAELHISVNLYLFGIVQYVATMSTESEPKQSCSQISVSEAPQRLALNWSDSENPENMKNNPSVWLQTDY